MTVCRRVTILLMLLLLEVSVLGSVGRLELLFEKANDKYLNGDYSGAIELYEKILQEGYESDKVYYNLGNAYYRLGKLGKAILFYEKALKLSPGDENVRFNLRLANLRIKDRVDVPPPFFLIRFYRAVKDLQSSQGWALSFVITTLLASIMVAIIVLYHGRVVLRVVKILLVVLVFLAVVDFVFMVDKYNDETLEKYGIVLPLSLECLSAPQEGSTVLFIVHEGLKVRVLDREDGWFKIELPDGKQGWVKEETIGII